MPPTAEALFFCSLAYPAPPADLVYLAESALNSDERVRASMWARLKEPGKLVPTSRLDVTGSARKVLLKPTEPLPDPHLDAAALARKVSKGTGKPKESLPDPHLGEPKSALVMLIPRQDEGARMPVVSRPALRAAYREYAAFRCAQPSVTHSCLPTPVTRDWSEAWTTHLPC